MLTVFRSKAGADVLMLWPHAEAVLLALGRESSPEGVFRGVQRLQALQAWAQWVDREANHARSPADEADDETAPEAPTSSPALQQRAWPVCELLRRAEAQDHDVVWQTT